jgi:DNA-binding CsgD family transcriptional regulator
MVQLAHGQRAKAEELWRQVAELAERMRMATVGFFVAERDVILVIVDGRLEEALVLLRRLVDLADESGAPIRGRTFGANLLIAPAMYLGRAKIWLTESEELLASASVVQPASGVFLRTAWRAICLAQLARAEEAQAIVRPVLNDLESSLDDERWVAELVMPLQAAVVVEHQGACQALAERLACVAHVTGEAQADIRTCVARHLGDAALVMGDRRAARVYYKQAVDSAGKIRFRPELALSHLRLAELLSEDDAAERSEALEHLNVALSELRDMHMQPALERAEALRHRLEPAQVHTPHRMCAADGLTSREREIAALIAEGRSNHDIAERLVISEGTVEVHVKHILSKLGFKSRSQVAGWLGRQHGEEFERCCAGRTRTERRHQALYWS